MTLEKVRELLAAQLRMDAAAITENTRLVEDLRVDSANMLSMILDLETEFGIEVEDEVILNLKTVGDVVKYIDSHQG